MDEEQFETKLRKMFEPLVVETDYLYKKAEAEGLIKAAIKDTIQYAGGTWKNDVAAERFKQWEWVNNGGKHPKPDEPPTLKESTLHGIYKTYLKERGYTAIKLPERQNIRTPDFIIEKDSNEFINEFKAPELVFNRELGLYKFQTTHSKILKFISTAVKQFHDNDGEHSKPWILTFASTHFQLNWNSFIQTMQGGVAYDDKLSPDFTNTEVFKRVIKKAQEIDLFIWLQVNSISESPAQISFITKQDSQYTTVMKDFIADLRSREVSSMDNIIAIEWPSSAKS